MVQIEIEVDKLESLFNEGILCATDFRSLNDESKQSIWNLCLTTCVKRLNCHFIKFDHSLHKKL